MRIVFPVSGNELLLLCNNKTKQAMADQQRLQEIQKQIALLNKEMNDIYGSEKSEYQKAQREIYDATKLGRLFVIRHTDSVAIVRPLEAPRHFEFSANCTVPCVEFVFHNEAKVVKGGYSASLLFRGHLFGSRRLDALTEELNMDQYQELKEAITKAFGDRLDSLFLG